VKCFLLVVAVVAIVVREFWGLTRVWQRTVSSEPWAACKTWGRWEQTHIEWKKREPFVRKTGSLLEAHSEQRAFLAAGKIWGRLGKTHVEWKKREPFVRKAGSLLVAHGEQRASDRVQDLGSLESAR